MIESPAAQVVLINGSSLVTKLPVMFVMPFARMARTDASSASGIFVRCARANSRVA